MYCVYTPHISHNRHNRRWCTFSRRCTFFHREHGRYRFMKVYAENITHKIPYTPTKKPSTPTKIPSRQTKTRSTINKTLIWPIKTKYTNKISSTTTKIPNTPTKIPSMLTKNLCRFVARQFLLYIYALFWCTFCSPKNMVVYQKRQIFGMCVYCSFIF